MLFTCLTHFPSLNFAHCFVLLMCCFPPFSRNHMLSIPPSGLKVLKETHYPISLPRGMMGDAALIMWLPAWSPTAFWVEELTAEQFTSVYLSRMWWRCGAITYRDRSEPYKNTQGSGSFRGFPSDSNWRPPHLCTGAFNSLKSVF